MKSSVDGWTPDLTVPEQRDVISHTSVIIRFKISVFFFFFLLAKARKVLISVESEWRRKEGWKEGERVM